MLYRAINQDGGYSARRLTRIDEPPVTQWAMATRLQFRTVQRLRTANPSDELHRARFDRGPHPLP